MKKIFSILTIFIIGLFLIPNIVNASEVKTVNGRTYVIDSAYELEIDEVSGPFNIFEVYNDNLYVKDSSNKLYKVTEEGKGVLATDEEEFYAISTFYKNQYRYYLANDGSIIRCEYYDSNKLELTTDTTVVEGKEYFTSGEVYVDNPSDNPSVQEYKEYVYYVMPDKYEIDLNKTYYTKSGSIIEPVFTPVDSPVITNILNYYVKVTPDKLFISTGVQVDMSKFNMEEISRPYTGGGLSISGKYNGKFILLFSGSKNSKLEYLYFDTEGNQLEWCNISTMYAFWEETSNILYVKMPVDENPAKLGLLDPNHDEIFSVTGRAAAMYVLDNVTYIYDTNSNLYKVTMYELETGSGQTYSNQNLTFKFNGDLSLLSSVKVNGVLLDASNYTKTKGSTIITLKQAYLDTLETGTYTLTVAYTDGGTASTTFTVPAPDPTQDPPSTTEPTSSEEVSSLEENPNTSDEIMTSVLLGGISILGLGITMYLKKKKVLN